MKIKIADGEISFRQYLNIGKGSIPDDVDNGESALQRLVLSDTDIKSGYVSLKSPPIQIAAAGLVLHKKGRIAKLGWVNIIQASSRTYEYKNGLEITELVNDLPTWDGGEEGLAPFYFGDWYGTHEGDEDKNSCVAVLEENTSEKIGYGDDIIFNDAPCMPPSYDTYSKNGIPLGLFRIKETVKNEVQYNLMTGITGKDRYIACLTVVDNKDQHTVVWSVPWDVIYKASVTPHLSNTSLPMVTVDTSSKVRLNIEATHDAQTLLDVARKKAGGEIQKGYVDNKHKMSISL